jgi:uncharacterized protein YqeY
MDPHELRRRLKTSLKEAMLARDIVSVAAIRSAVSALDNAEAVDRPHRPDSAGGRIATAALGVGSADVARRKLSTPEMLEVIRAEVDDLRHAAAEYVRRGRLEQARRLTAEAEVLLAFFDGARTPDPPAGGLPAGD